MRTSRDRRTHRNETAYLALCGFAVCVLTVAGDSEDAASKTAATLNLQSDETEKKGDRPYSPCCVRVCLHVPGGHVQNLLVS